MVEPWKRVLQEHGSAIVKYADEGNVFLNHLIDHLFSKRCIQQDHKQLVKREPIVRTRISMLLDFVSSEGRNAFDELCNAIEEFKPEMEELANRLRASLRKQKMVSGTLQFDRLVVSHQCRRRIRYTRFLIVKCLRFSKIIFEATKIQYVEYTYLLINRTNQLLVLI